MQTCLKDNAFMLLESEKGQVTRVGIERYRLSSSSKYSCIHARLESQY